MHRGDEYSMVGMNMAVENYRNLHADDDKDVVDYSFDGCGVGWVDRSSG